jgi:hypothetical protein
MMTKKQSSSSTPPEQKRRRTKAGRCENEEEERQEQEQGVRVQIIIDSTRSKEVGGADEVILVLVVLPGFTKDLLLLVKKQTRKGSS